MIPSVDTRSSPANEEGLNSQMPPDEPKSNNPPDMLVADFATKFPMGRPLLKP